MPSFAFEVTPTCGTMLPCKIISLQSGSNGNCIYVEADGVKLLFDAGISGIQVQDRLALHGRDAAASMPC